MTATRFCRWPQCTMSFTMDDAADAVLAIADHQVTNHGKVYGPENQRAATRRLLDGRECNTADVARELGFSESRARDILNDLERTGVAQVVEGSRPRRWLRVAP